MCRSFHRLRTGASLVVVPLVVMFIGLASALMTRDIRAAATFTPGNLVVYRVGTGVGSLVNSGNPVFLDEYTPGGALVQSIALPTTTSGSNRRLIASGTATSEGLMTRSTDGRYLVLSGYDAAIPTTGLAGTTAAAVPRVVGRVDASGGIDTTTGLTDWASGNNPRGTTSTDGHDLWIGGAAGGVRYTTLGSSSSTQLSTTVTNIRGVEIFSGQLFESDSSGSAVRLGTVGTGLPTTAGQTITNLPGFPTGGSPYGFFFADLDAGVSGIDTLYVADDGAGLMKFSLVGGTWVSNGTVGTSADTYRGLTGVAGGTTVTLYATRKGGSGATGGGELVRVLDASGYNGVFSASPLVIATAAANTAFRGVAATPAEGTAPPFVSLSVSTHTASEAAQTSVTVTAATSAPVAGDQVVALAVGGAGITAGDYTLSTATITIADGDSSGSVTFTAANDGVLEGTEAATLTLTNPSSGLALGSPITQEITILDSSTAPPACSTSVTAIHAIQGAGLTAAITGTVSVRGVVVGDYEGASPALRGFYLQDLNPDADPATSEGIFVFEGSNANTVSLGQVVQVTGNVDEFHNQTEISASVIENCGITATVTPVDVTLPVPADVNGVPYLERFEGMLVRFHQTLFVTEHFQLGRFGQIVMSSSSRLPQPTSIAAPGAAAIAQQAANDLNRIIVDDEQNNQNPDPIEFGRLGNPLSASNTLRGGDRATDIVGVMTYGWAGNSASGDAYRLRPIDALGGGVPGFQPSNPRPSAPPDVGGSLKVVGMNVLNYFLTLDNNQPICGPAGFEQQCRGAETATELARQQQKLNQALLKLDADVIGMSELENTPGVDPLADIANRLNTSLGSSVYAWIDTGVIGTDDIRVGILYKPAKVTPVGAPLVDLNPVHNRPPVAQLFSANADGERFTVVVNHFRSKGCSSNPANPLDNDQGDGQGCFNARRVQQAQALVTFVQNTVVPAVHDPNVLLVGDFNSYAKEDPIRTLEQAGFTNLVSRFSGARAYSYVFDAQWGYIDHALASGTLLTQVTNAGDYHINADEPSVLDYNTNFKSPGQVAGLFNADEFRIADHDPVVVGFALHPFPSASPDTYTVEAGTTLTVGGQGVLGNDTGGPLALFSHTTAHGTLTLNANGSFTYTPAAGFVGVDTFEYTAMNAAPVRSLQVFATSLPPLATIGGISLTAGAYGSAVAPVPGSIDEFYGLTDRGPNVDGPGGTKIEPLPSFTPAIGKFKLTGGQAVLEAIIPLQAADGTPYSGRVSTQADTGETITDLDGNVLAKDPNGYDSEGLVALPDGTFWVSDEYGPFITHFDATGKQIGRLSPFDGILPRELAARVVNRGMEGLTITPDGSMLVGIMQSALQQSDLSGFDAKKLTPLRIVTYRIADGAVREYLYLLDNPNITKTAVSEITALSDTIFLVDERDGNFPPGAYKKIFMIDISGATDIGPASAVPAAIYDAGNGGLLISGKTIENLLRTGSTPFDTPTSVATLAANGITPVAKGLHFDLGALLAGVDPLGRFFSHDKIEGVAAVNGGATLVITNDSDFGIDGVVNSVPPFQLHAKITPAGVQDDGEFLVVDLVRSTATVTINVVDTTAPVITSVTPDPASIWPVNKRMVPVTIVVGVIDSVDPSPQCHVTSITSNQGTSADWQITGPLSVSLRADRTGNGGDRIYTIAVQCSDAPGNVSVATTTVVVPHDQGKQK